MIQFKRIKYRILQKVISSLAILIIINLIGCQPESKQLQKPKTTGLPMKVAKNYWPGQYWLDVGNKKGWFKDAGLNVEFINITSNYVGSLEDMVAGKTDVHFPVFFDLIKYIVKDTDLVAVIICDLSFGADGIVAKKEIESVRDLKGKRVGLEQGTFTEYLLSVVLERNGMTLNDVEIVETKAEFIQPFIEGKLDALVTWEPYLSEATEKKIWA